MGYLVHSESGGQHVCIFALHAGPAIAKGAKGLADVVGMLNTNSSI